LFLIVMESSNGNGELSGTVAAGRGRLDFRSGLDTWEDGFKIKVARKGLPGLFSRESGSAGHAGIN
jgi:hypothetical protein